jgi:hypothetical protein
LFITLVSRICAAVGAAGWSAFDATTLIRTFTQIGEAGLMNTVKTKADVKVGCARCCARFFG